MNVTRLCISTIIALLTLPGTAAAESPNEADLHSAYCVPVLQYEIAQTQRGGDRQMLEKLQAALNQVQAYLHPRMPKLDPMALAQMQSRAQGDIQQFQKGVQCMGNCASGKDDPTKTEAAACTKSCMDMGAVAHMDTCTKLIWLPN